MSLRSLASALADTLADGGWRAKARPSQLPPAAFTGDGSAYGWAFMGGRGVGKTRAGSEWVRELVETGAARHIALIGATAGDVRDIMVEGPSGILAVSSPRCRPIYEPSKRRISWPSSNCDRCPRNSTFVHLSSTARFLQSCSSSPVPAIRNLTPGQRAACRTTTGTRL